MDNIAAKLATAKNKTSGRQAGATRVSICWHRHLSADRHQALAQRSIAQAYQQ